MSVLRSTAGLASLAAIGIPILLAPLVRTPPPLPSGRTAGTAPRPVSADSLVPPADHHMHIWSPDAVEMLLRAQEAVGQEVLSADEARPLTADNAIAALDSAGIRRGVLLSTAYFFGFPDLEVEDEEMRVRAENDYVAREAARYPDRLVAFFSVNPLADYALDEIARCADDSRFTGLKLHLGNSNVDLADPGHVRRLREVFEAADAHELPIVIHLKNPRADYGRAAAETFLDEILPAAPHVTVQVAHLAGDGGFDEPTREAVDVFADALEGRPELTRNLIFDYSATPIPSALARGDSTLLEQVRAINAMVVTALRKIPADRLLYGTDWPAVSEPGYLGIRSSIDLEEEELRALLDGAAPYLP